jgi:hypothetical protein
MARTIHCLAAAALMLSGAVALAQTTAQSSGAARTNRAQASGHATAGASAGTSANTNQTGSVAAGTALHAELSQSVDSKKAKAGDPITAHTTEAIKMDGKVVIPKGTKLVGHVTRASARSKGDADSVLAMQFDRAILKDGRELPLQATVQALAVEQRAAAVGPEDLQPAGNAGNIEGGAAGAGSAGNRGVVGGVGNTVGGAASGAASTVPRTTENATGAVNSTVSSAANANGRAETGLSPSGELLPTSRGVFGLNGLNLNANAANSTEGSVITSAGKNVHLDSGTRMLLVTQAATSASAQR